MNSPSWFENTSQASRGKKIPCVFEYFQAVDTECNNSVSYLGICFGLWNPMENYGLYCSNFLRCHTSREQRLIRTFESNAFFTFTDIREQNTNTWLRIAWFLFWSDTCTVNEKILLIYILSLTVSREQKTNFCTMKKCTMKEWCCLLYTSPSPRDA